MSQRQRAKCSENIPNNPSVVVAENSDNRIARVFFFRGHPVSLNNTFAECTFLKTHERLFC